MSSQRKTAAPINYLMRTDSPQKKTTDFYQFDETKKLEFGEVWGT